MAPAAYDDVLSIQVRRHKLEEWVNKPFFMTNLHNAVVRVSVPGTHSAGGRQYLMAVVESVSEEEGKIKCVDYWLKCDGCTDSAVVRVSSVFHAMLPRCGASTHKHYKNPVIYAFCVFKHHSDM